MRISPPVPLPDGRIARGRFDAATIALHWTSVSLVLFQFASGWAMSEYGALATMPDLLIYHRSAGTLVWLVTLARLCWRRFWATFPPFPSHLWQIGRWTAQVTEYALYTMLVAQPTTGLVFTLLRGRPLPLFMVSIPAILPRNLELSEQFHQIHILGAMVFAGLVVFHAAAALVHHLVWRDDVLELMAPVLRRRAEPSDMGDEVLEAQP